MRIYKPRGLNIDESYACNRTAVRKCFEKQDISISWGNPEKYAGRQAAQGSIVVASLVVKRIQRKVRFSNPNRRPLPLLCEERLYFYIITDSAYDAQQKLSFEDDCLPRMRQWFDAHIALEQPGREELVVIWNGSDFSFLEKAI